MGVEGVWYLLSEERRYEIMSKRVTRERIMAAGKHSELILVNVDFK